MVARGLHDRLEGRGEHLLDSTLPLACARMRIISSSQRIDRAVAFASQLTLSSSSGLFRRQPYADSGGLVDEGQHLGPHLGEHIAEMFIIGADAA